MSSGCSIILDLPLASAGITARELAQRSDLCEIVRVSPNSKPTFKVPQPQPSSPCDWKRDRPAVLKFISENMRLSGFSGELSEKARTYEPDMKAIAESARRLGAQIPFSQR